MVALNDAGCSEPGEPSDPIVIDVPGVQIAPYFVQMLNDCIALEHEKVGKLTGGLSPLQVFAIICPWIVMV